MTYADRHAEISAWRKKGTTTDYILKLLISGSPDVWLDPLLPIYALGEPDKYRLPLINGAVTAAAEVACGRQKVGRALVRSSDDYRFLRSQLQESWQCRAQEETPRAQELARRLLAIYPWEKPYPHASYEGDIDVDTDLSVEQESLLLTQAFRRYTRWVVDLAEQGAGFTGSPPELVRNSQARAAFVRALGAWVSNPERTAAEHIELVRESGTLLSVHYATNTGPMALISHMFSWRENKSDDYEAANNLILESFRTCPLLDMLPSVDEVRYEDYDLIPTPQIL